MYMSVSSSIPRNFITLATDIGFSLFRERSFFSSHSLVKPSNGTPASPGNRSETVELTNTTINFVDVMDKPPEKPG
jgi:hypothetical protein